MTSPSALPNTGPTDEQLDEAERLFLIAEQKDREAEEAKTAAKAYFKKIGRTMPLFDRVKGPDR